MRKTPAEIGKCLLGMVTREHVLDIRQTLIAADEYAVYYVGRWGSEVSIEQITTKLKEMIYELIMKECFEMYREVSFEGLRVSYIHWPMAETECRIDVCPVSFSVGK